MALHGKVGTEAEAPSNTHFHTHDKVTNANNAANGLDVWLTSQNPYHDMHSYHPGAASEFSSEFNLLNDFLQSSLIDDGASLTDSSYGQPLTSTRSRFGSVPGFGADGSGSNATHTTATVTTTAISANVNLLASRNPPRTTMPMPPPNSHVPSVARPGTALGSVDKAREYYLQAADPSGNDTPEARMQRVLKAKYDAGLLKPFNYIKGYSCLSSYLDGHVAPTSKQKILRQIDRFRPKFREKILFLTDVDLVFVEMWFETSLMEYERVFASMAVPACCWRRTGEIFRGNKEMAELIDVPVERLRDGKIALHEILTEESVVRYWEEFGTIAFDPAHDTLLTACSVKSPDDKPNQPIVKCCFSFMIRRDDHKIPSLIVGHFVPHDP